jgi:hypothetical protein
MNDNVGALVKEVGPQVFDALGQIIHRIFSQAATTVPYNDIFNGTE